MICKENGEGLNLVEPKESIGGILRSLRSVLWGTMGTCRGMSMPSKLKDIRWLGNENHRVLLLRDVLELQD